MFDISKHPHRRKNALTGDWVLVSPQRTQRPWQGEISAVTLDSRPQYDPECYLCPGNERANGEINPQYKETFVFTNDFSALLKETPAKKIKNDTLLELKSERGICRVINFSPKHNLTLAEMSDGSICRVIDAWQTECDSLSKESFINHIQIFENKGAVMGNSNPHPHCQIWAQESIPAETHRELKQFTKYFSRNKTTILSDYIKIELKHKERIVFENTSFVVVVPFWAVWPFETLIVPKRKIQTIGQLTESEKKDFANTLSTITIKYDNLFKTSFPYSSGIHQAPCDGKPHKEFHFHMHFFPPLLRSASIKKFMVGYELLAEPQRDITPEYSAKVLRELPSIHYNNR